MVKINTPTKVHNAESLPISIKLCHLKKTIIIPVSPNINIDITEFLISKDLLFVETVLSRILKAIPFFSS